MAEKSKKIKIPKSVLSLRMSLKKFAKENNIKLKGKGLSKKEKKRNQKTLINEYSENAIVGLNKAVKILAENPKGKKVDKIEKGVENIISNQLVMDKISKIYKKNPKEYEDLKYLPNMIMNTILYYQSDNISEEEKEIGKSLNVESLVEFCEKILKKEIKTYKKMGLSQEVSFRMATVIPTTKLFKSRKWYKELINLLYEIAETEEVDVDEVLKAVLKVDKKKSIKKKDFLNGFFSELIFKKYSNKQAKYTDTQKELNNTLTERALIYLDAIKKKELKSILKEYIKRRKNAEEYKSDGKRMIKFTDHANSNSPYTNIKEVVQELISDNANNETYLS